MTLEELREEAAKHGYYLAKKQTYTNAMPKCKCGARIPYKQINDKGEIYLQCKKCGLAAAPGATGTERRKNWVKLVRGEECSQ